MADIGDVVYWLAFDGQKGFLVPLAALVVRKLRLDELELHVFYHRDKLGAAPDGRLEAVHGMRRGGWVYRDELLAADGAESVEDVLFSTTGTRDACTLVRAIAAEECLRAITEFRGQCGRDGAPESNWCFVCRSRKLVEDETPKRLHGVRERKRRPFWDAAMQSDPEDKTVPCGNCAGCRNDDACLENG